MKRRAPGFTLLELMVGLVLFSILLAIAVPSFRSLIQNNAVTSAHNDLITSLQLARSEALKRNRPVSVCATTDGEACGDDADWQSGFMAFTDRGAPGVVDGDDEILQRWQPQNSALELVSDDESAHVQFLPTGMVAEAANLNVSAEGCTGQKRRQITVLVSGSVSSQLTECS